jgi:hypothetical protein
MQVVMYIYLVICYNCGDNGEYLHLLWYVITVEARVNCRRKCLHLEWYVITVETRVNAD